MNGTQKRMKPSWGWGFTFLTKLWTIFGALGFAMLGYAHGGKWAAFGASIFALALFTFLSEIIYQLAVISDWDLHRIGETPGEDQEGTPSQ